MFKTMRRFGQALTEPECLEILEKQPRGVMALHGDNGYPHAFPMDYILHDGKLYFHSAKEGYKIDCLEADPQVTFCVMDEGYRKEGSWSLIVRSVILYGTVRVIEDPEEKIRLLHLLGNKYYPDPDEVEDLIRRSAGKACVLELSIRHMTGKSVDES